MEDLIDLITPQFGDTPEFTWGKRSRLRERQLWLVDDGSYYARQGGTAHWRTWKRLLLKAPLLPASALRTRGPQYCDGRPFAPCDILQRDDAIGCRHDTIRVPPHVPRPIIIIQLSSSSLLSP